VPSSGRILVVASDLRKRRKSFDGRITWISELIVLTNTAVIGWVKDRLYSLILEIREDKDGEYFHLVTLWRSTREEKKLYEENL
jgi:hypothetical protein